MFEKAKKDRNEVIEKIDEKIDKCLDSDDSASAEAMVKLIEVRHRTKFGGLDTSEILKIVGNVAVAATIIVFEMGFVMNQKASRFIKTM